MNDLINEMKVGFDSDYWGSGMICFFSVAHEMYHRDLDIPNKWGFSPGVGSGDLREHDDYCFPFCEDATDETLLNAGNILNKYTSYLRYNQLDY